MPKNIFSRVQSRSLTRHHKIAMAGVATLGAAAIGFSAVPSGASTKTTTEAAQPVAVAYSTQQIKDVKASVTDQMAGASLKAEQIAAKKKADAAAAAKKKAAAEAAKKKAEAARQAKEAASR
ncbi:transglycosylase SLT domain-containing protein, partial [Streptomyces massasporeus]